MWYTQPLSAKEILDELEISKDDNYRAFSILKDEDLELHLQLHLKREPNSRLVNNYFGVGLKPCRQLWTYNLFLRRISQWHIPYFL